MKGKLLIAIACSSITVACYSLATSREFDLLQLANEPVGYTRTFTPTINEDPYSYPFHGHAATVSVVFCWNGESNSDGRRRRPQAVWPFAPTQHKSTPANLQRSFLDDCGAETASIRRRFAPGDYDRRLANTC